MVVYLVGSTSVWLLGVTGFCADLFNTLVETDRDGLELSPPPAEDCGVGTGG